MKRSSPHSRSSFKKKLKSFWEKERETARKKKSMETDPPKTRKRGRVPIMPGDSKGPNPRKQS